MLHWSSGTDESVDRTLLCVVLSLFGFPTEAVAESSASSTMDSGDVYAPMRGTRRTNSKSGKVSDKGTCWSRCHSTSLPQPRCTTAKETFPQFETVLNDMLRIAGRGVKVGEGKTRRRYKDGDGE